MLRCCSGEPGHLPPNLKGGSLWIATLSVTVDGVDSHLLTKTAENILLSFLWYKILAFRVIYTMTVQSKNRLCPRCKREFTDEEEAIKTQSCWFCLATYLKQIEEEDKIPNPVAYGHPNGYQELQSIESTEALRKLKPLSVEQPEKPALNLTDEERKQMLLKFGVDPLASQPITVITVKGKNDDTYLQFSTRGVISPEMKKQFEKWLKTQLDVLGTVVTFGPSYASTVLQMKMMTGMEFLKE
jgi:hypothetical protein